MGQSGLFVKRLGEVGFEKRKGTWTGSAKDIDGGRNEKLERNHCGDGIPRESENESLAASSEDGGLAGADGDRVEIKFGAERFQDGLDKVVFAHGHAARENEDVLLEAELNFRAQVVDTVE